MNPKVRFTMSDEVYESSHLKQNPVASVIGNVLEWYDFAVFGYLAPIIGHQFFPSEDKMASLINVFGVFAIGYIIRPLGGIIFGQIGDRYGRKKALVLSVAMMAIPTTLVGCLPTYAQVGILAPLLMLILRIFQGVSVGGELIGSISYLVEVAPPKRRGYLGSWSLFSAVAGILLGSIAGVLVNTFMSREVLQAWGWRIPFFAGLIIGIAGVWMRRSMVESPEFLMAEKAEQIQKTPIVEAFRTASGRIIQTMLMNMVMGTGLYMLFLWMPTYLQSILHPPVPHALLINSVAMVFLILVMPCAGWLSDKVGRKPLLLAAVVGMGTTVYPLFLLIDTGNPWIVLIVQFVFAIWVGILYGVMPATMGELFPANIRYSAMGIGYNVAFALFCGTAPMVSTYLVKVTGVLTSPAIYLIVLALVSLPAFILLKPAREFVKTPP
jgi:MHS family proline/betaine transporter-like MFS transporter